jgi:hypothetical protein
VIRKTFGFVILALVIAGWLAAGAAAGSAKTVWLCRPGASPDPCTSGLSTTVYTPRFKKIGVEHPRAVAHPRIDCFYVYPTVSTQETGNANLSIDPQERSIALYQAARFSQYCRVFAPMYRQVTDVSIGFGQPTTQPNLELAYSDVQSAFEAYLNQYNDGRGFVLIGHSQGSLLLRQLMIQDVDANPAVRRRLVSAILLGGNVLVQKGKTSGGDFENIPACRSAGQLGCVIAYSTFDQTPPSGSTDGRPETPNESPVNDPNLHVLCTNPAALAGGSGLLDPIFPRARFAPNSMVWNGLEAMEQTPTPRTVWWSAPGSYRARCTTSNGATVLEVTPLGGAPRPVPEPDPTWGLHLLDANIALGNLISIVKAEAAAYTRSR